jgi:uncharacterized protein (DUF4415 family)
MRDEDIDLSDLPEATPEMFARGIVRRGVLIPRKKENVTLRLDADVIKWFRACGEIHPALINMLLREFMDKHLVKPTKRKSKASRKKAAA